LLQQIAQLLPLLAQFLTQQQPARTTGEAIAENGEDISGDLVPDEAFLAGETMRESEAKSSESVQSESTATQAAKTGEASLWEWVSRHNAFANPTVEWLTEAFVESEPMVLESTFEWTS
jgi:hypothetical protein